MPPLAKKPLTASMRTWLSSSLIVSVSGIDALLASSLVRKAAENDSKLVSSSGTIGLPSVPGAERVTAFFRTPMKPAVLVPTPAIGREPLSTSLT